MRVRGLKVTTVSRHEDIYNDNLRDVFERATGLKTSMGMMGAK
jgi:hypothetical protein